MGERRIVDLGAIGEFARGGWRTLGRNPYDPFNDNDTINNHYPRL